MSKRLPGIWIERNDSDMPNALYPDREFWRYLFAGMAMQGIAVDKPSRELAAGMPGSIEQGVAHLAVDQADALLAELEREGDGDG